MAKNYTKEQVLEAVKNSAGVMEYIAQRLNCNWHTAKKYVEKWEETEDAFAVSECKLHTIAYKSFHKAVAAGERWAVERILDTSARRNGHGAVQHAKLDHTSKGEAIRSISPIEFVAPKPEADPDDVADKS